MSFAQSGAMSMHGPKSGKRASGVAKPSSAAKRARTEHRVCDCCGASSKDLVEGHVEPEPFAPPSPENILDERFARLSSGLISVN